MLLNYYKSTMKKLLKLSLLTIPISIITFLIIDYFMSFVMGGFATVRGFPIPFYRNVWNTPEIDFNQPIIAIVDVLIIFLFTTFLALVLLKQDIKSEKPTNVTL